MDNPRWKSQWPGKKIFAADDTSNAAIALIKGKVNPSNKAAAHQIDGLAGATLTSVGVTNLVQFWLSENGYAPFLAKLRAGEV